MRTHTRIALIASAAGIAAALIIATIAIMFGTTTVQGTPVANHDQVVAAQQEKAEAEAQALAAVEAANVSQLEGYLQPSMQEFFSDPANNLTDYGLTVTAVTVIHLTGNTYQGMATMTSNGGTPHGVLVHVTWDGDNVMWNTDAGALLPVIQ